MNAQLAAVTTNAANAASATSAAAAADTDTQQWRVKGCMQPRSSRGCTRPPRRSQQALP